MLSGVQVDAFKCRAAIIHSTRRQVKPGKAVERA
jgi:hypothetical protein